MILIVSHQHDEHARAVQAALDDLGAEHHLLDLADFPERSAMTLRYAEGRPLDATWTSADGRRIDMRKVRSVWYRRPQPMTIHPGIARPSHASFALNECSEAIAGLWQTIDAFWINHPVRDQVAARKIHQLEVARGVGLKVPATLVTNDPDQPLRFMRGLGDRRFIYKAFSATRQEWRETRLVGPEELATLEHVRHAPVIFQEYIEADVDLRVTIIGDDILPAAIHSQETDYPADFRIDMGRADVEATTLPADIERNLLAFLRQLGIVYGAIDLRRTPGGDHIFLEVNPAGQWLFVEQRTGQPIALTLARALARAGGG